MLSLDIKCQHLPPLVKRAFHFKKPCNSLCKQEEPHELRLALFSPAEMNQTTKRFHTQEFEYTSANMVGVNALSALSFRAEDSSLFTFGLEMNRTYQS